MKPARFSFGHFLIKRKKNIRPSERAERVARRTAPRVRPPPHARALSLSLRLSVPQRRRQGERRRPWAGLRRALRRQRPSTDRQVCRMASQSLASSNPQCTPVIASIVVGQKKKNVVVCRCVHPCPTMLGPPPLPAPPLAAAAAASGAAAAAAAATWPAASAMVAA